MLPGDKDGEMSKQTSMRALAAYGKHTNPSSPCTGNLINGLVAATTLMYNHSYEHSKNKVPIVWSENFAYAIGLIVTDGCLSKDERHISFVSKDLDLINTFQFALGIQLNIGKTNSGSVQEKRYHRVQIGDVTFYRFLRSIGLMSNKTKIINEVQIPDAYFPDFLRGRFDGDGSFYSYFDPRWKSSYMYYTVFNSASPKHITWLREKIYQRSHIKGHVTKTIKHSCLSLKYAKTESNILLSAMYYQKGLPCLERKRLKILKALSIVLEPENARVEKLVDSSA